MADTSAITAAIAKFKNAVLGREVRQAMVDIGEAVKDAVENQIAELDDGSWTAGKAAEAKVVGENALLYRGSLASLGVTRLSAFTTAGFAHLTSAWVSSVTDLPSDYSSGAALVINYKASTGTYQKIEKSNGNVWERYVYTSGTVDSWKHIYDPSSITTISASVAALESNLSELSDTVNDTPSIINASIGAGSVYDWSRLANTTYPTGWTTGYCSVSDGSLTTTSPNWIRMRGRYSAPFRGYDYCIITPPTGYRVWVCEYTADSTSSFVKTWGDNDEANDGKSLFVEITEGHYYAITLGRFANGDAESYLTSEFVSSIKLERFYSESRNNKESTDQKGTQIHFSVSINATQLEDNAADASNALSVNAVVMLPSTYKAYGKPTKAIFLHHGQSGTVTDTTWYSQADQTTWKALLNSYLNAGFAVFDVNGCGPADGTTRYHRDYGCFNGIQAAYKAYQYLIATYNIDARIFVHGGSMGGATAISFVKAYPGIVSALVLFAPAEVARSAQTTSYRLDIAQNYGYADIAAMEADGYKNLIPAMPDVEHYDAEGNRVFLPVTADWAVGSAYTGLTNLCKLPCPVKAWHGADDDTTRPAYTRALITAAFNAGVQAFYTEVSGVGHELTVGASATANAEAVLWLSRFD